MNYTPEPGDLVYLTVRATVTDAGNYRTAGRLGPYYIPVGAETIVRVEPAPTNLPTRFGAIIRASITGETDKPTRLVRFFLDHPRPWISQSTGICYSDARLTNVEVIFEGVEP